MRNPREQQNGSLIRQLSLRVRIRRHARHSSKRPVLPALYRNQSQFYHRLGMLTSSVRGEYHMESYHAFLSQSMHRPIHLSDATAATPPPTTNHNSFAM